MKVKTQNILAFIGIGVGLVAPWASRKKANEPPPPKSKKFAFVADPTGEPIYASPGNELIIRLGYHKYLGILTGEVSGQYFEVADLTEDGKNEYYFWVDSARIYKIEGQDNARDHLENGQGVHKTKEEFNQIISKLS